MENKIEIKVWAQRGNMLVRTEYLEYDDPDHPYNQVIAQGAVPEDYGIVREDLKAIIGDKTKEMLAIEIIDLKRQLIEMHRHF